MSARHDISATPGRRADQWLWFARLMKTRSLAARLCAAGAVTLNRTPVRKPNQVVRVGDVLVTPQGAFQRTVRVLALGSRRGPASEARQLYEEIAAPVRIVDLPSAWQLLLIDTENED